MGCPLWDIGQDNNLYQCCQFCTYEAIAPYYLDDCAKKAWIIVTLKGNKTIESSNLPLSIGNLVQVFDPSLKLHPIHPEVPNAFGVLERLIWVEPGYILASLHIVLNMHSIHPSPSDNEHHFIAIPSDLISKKDRKTLLMREGTVGQRLDTGKDVVAWPLHYFEAGATGYKGEFAEQIRFASQL